MDKIRPTDAGTDQQPQPGAADSTNKQDGGQPQAVQTGWGEADAQRWKGSQFKGQIHTW